MIRVPEGAPRTCEKIWKSKDSESLRPEPFWKFMKIQEFGAPEESQDLFGKLWKIQFYNKRVAFYIIYIEIVLKIHHMKIEALGAPEGTPWTLP